MKKLLSAWSALNLPNQLTLMRIALVPVYLILLWAFGDDRALCILPLLTFVLASLTDLEGESIRPAQVKVLRQTQQTAELSITIHEGKNRQIRRMCAACGLTVRRLKRVREGSLTLDRTLAPGQWRPLTPVETARLKEDSFLHE